MWNTTCPHFPHIRLGLNPYREIVFRSTSQIAGARTVNRLFSPFSDVRKKKGLRKSAGPSTLMRKIGFLLSFCGGAFEFQGFFWWTIQDLKFAVAVLSAVIRSQNVLISMGSGILFYYSVLPFFIWQQFIKAKNKAKNPSADILNIDR